MNSSAMVILNFQIKPILSINFLKNCRYHNICYLIYLRECSQYLQTYGSAEEFQIQFINYMSKAFWILYVGLGTGLPIFNREFLKTR